MEKQFRSVSGKSSRGIALSAILLAFACQFTFAQGAVKYGYYRGDDGEPFWTYGADGSVKQLVYPVFGPSLYLQIDDQPVTGTLYDEAIRFGGPETRYGTWPLDTADTTTAMATTSEGLLVLGSRKGSILLLDTAKKSIVCSASLSAGRVTRIAATARCVVASFTDSGGNNSCWIVDVEQHAANRLVKTDLVYDIFFSPRGDKVGILAMYSDSEGREFYSSFYNAPSGDFILRAKGGRRGAFFDSTRVSLESASKQKSTDAKGTLGYSTYDLDTRQLTRSSLPVISVFPEYGAVSRKVIPSDVASWGEPLHSIDSEDMKSEAPAPAKRTLPALRPSPEDERKGLNPGEGALLTLGGLPVGIINALDWNGKTIVQFYPAGEIRNAIPESEWREKWGRAIAVLDEFLRPQALFKLAMNDFASMAVAGDKLVIFDNPFFSVVDLNTFELRYFEVKPGFEHTHRMVASTDGNGVVVLGYNGASAPSALLFWKPGEASCAYYRMKINNRDSRSAGGSVIPLGSSYIISLADTVLNESESRYERYRAYLLMTQDGRITREVSFRAQGSMASAPVPITASVERSTIKAVYWAGDSFESLEWTPSGLSFSLIKDQRKRWKPRTDISGQEYHYGGFASGGTFILCTGSSYADLLFPYNGDFDSIWFGLTPGLDSLRGYTISETFGRSHPFEPRSIGVSPRGSYVLSGNIQGPLTKRGYGDGVLLRLSEVQLSALGKEVSLDGAGRMPGSRYSDKALPVSLEAQAARIEVDAFSYKSLTKSDPSLLGLQRLRLALDENRTAGVLNDTAVRMRDLPSLSGKEICRMDAETVVGVLGRSADKATIGTKKAYWFKVRLMDGREGWAYGWYVDCAQPESLPVLNP